jgi:hypothetical protein
MEMLLLQIREGEAAAEREIGPVPLWWLWLLIAFIAVVSVAWILKNLGPGGGRPRP